MRRRVFLRLSNKKGRLKISQDFVSIGALDNKEEKIFKKKIILRIEVLISIKAVLDCLEGANNFYIYAKSE